MSDKKILAKVELDERSQERWNIMEAVNKRLAAGGVRISMGPMGFVVEADYPRRFMDGVDLTVPGKDNTSKNRFDNLADAIGFALDHVEMRREWSE